ncbi:MAG: SDR family oxidoreductase [Paraglaciecola sp.]|uniref:SDR family NAD(P)-dependent oxidoreductase n=1 Tax=Paraglaciecola sp. TaxID=1920173 RepID=UPI003296C691
MKKDLFNQVALVTGGNGGIGTAICKLLASHGAKVVIHCHSRLELANELAASLPTESLVVQQDLSQPYASQVLIKKCIDHFGSLDILVNNAGWTKAIPASQLNALDDELIAKTMHLKINVPIRLVDEARTYLEKSDNANVVNITSVAGIAAKGSSIVYAAANAALSNLTRSLARVLAPTIRVNAVAPGFVNTGFVWPTDSNAAEHVSKQNYIGRTVEPEDVAKAVLFLVADARATTGEEMAIDGGIARLGNRQ